MLLTIWHHMIKRFFLVIFTTKYRPGFTLANLQQHCVILCVLNISEFSSKSICTQHKFAEVINQNPTTNSCDACLTVKPWESGWVSEGWGFSTLVANSNVFDRETNNESSCDLYFCIIVLMQHYPSFLPSCLYPPVDIREIRELRLGKGSRDFERYAEEARKLDSTHCFIVLYGLEFRLRTLSVAGQCLNCQSKFVFMSIP